MKTKIEHSNYRQFVFREMVLGILVYSLVLGFFADYTNFLTIGTQSVIFAAAIVLQILTFLTFQLKGRVARAVKNWNHRFYKPLLVFSVWLIMFLSKFVFLWAIDVIFGQAVNISGFMGLLLIVLTMTVTKTLIDAIYLKLAD